MPHDLKNESDKYLHFSRRLITLTHVWAILLCSDCALSHQTPPGALPLADLKGAPRHAMILRGADPTVVICANGRGGDAPISLLRRSGQKTLRSEARSRRPYQST